MLINHNVIVFLNVKKSVYILRQLTTYRKKIYLLTLMKHMKTRKKTWKHTQWKGYHKLGEIIFDLLPFWKGYNAGSHRIFYSCL